MTTTQTEDQKTQEAIDLIKASKTKEPKENKETPQPKVETEIEAKPETKKDEVVAQPRKLLHNQIDVGQVITLKPWNGKTKKKFKAQVELAGGIEKLTTPMILSILVYKHIKEAVTLSPAQEERVIMELTKMSIGPNYEMPYVCPKCDDETTLKGSIQDTCLYTVAKYPVSSQIGNYDIVIHAIPEKDKLDEITKEVYAMYDNGYEDEITPEEIKTISQLDITWSAKASDTDGNPSKVLTPKETVVFFDELPLIDLNNLMTQINEANGINDSTVRVTCDSCASTDIVDINLIPMVIKALL